MHSTASLLFVIAACLPFIATGFGVALGVDWKARRASPYLKQQQGFAQALPQRGSSDAQIGRASVRGPLSMSTPAGSGGGGGSASSVLSALCPLLKLFANTDPTAPRNRFIPSMTMTFRILGSTATGPSSELLPTCRLCCPTLDAGPDDAASHARCKEQHPWLRPIDDCFTGRSRHSPSPSPPHRDGSGASKCRPPWPPRHPPGPRHPSSSTILRRARSVGGCGRR